MKRLEVHVKPSAPKTKLLEQSEGFLKVAVKARAEGGQANLELIKFLKKKFGCDVKIVSGKTSRRKVVVLD